MYTTFDQLDKSSRLWVYQADRSFSESEKEFILMSGQAFVESWTAHSKALNASFQIKYDQFLILAVDESKAPATGCSIDKSVHFIKAIENELNLNLLDKRNVAFLEGQHVSLEKLSSIKVKIQAGEISEDQLTFNNIVNTKSDFESNWLIPSKESWMGRFFKEKA